MGDLAKLTAERKKQAFEKARAESNITEGTLILVTQEYYDDAIAIVKDVFTRDEPISRAVKARFTPLREEFWRAMLDQGMSLMVVNDDREVVALLTVLVETADQHFDHSRCDDPGWRIMREFVYYCKQRANKFEALNSRELIQFDALMVKPGYRQKGLATRLVNAALSMVRYFGLDSVSITGESSSTAVQKIFERAGFQTLFEIPFDQYEVDGKSGLRMPSEFKSEKVYGLAIKKH